MNSLLFNICFSKIVFFLNASLFIILKPQYQDIKTSDSRVSIKHPLVWFGFAM